MKRSLLALSLVAIAAVSFGGQAQAQTVKATGSAKAAATTTAKPATPAASASAVTTATPTPSASAPAPAAPAAAVQPNTSLAPSPPANPPPAPSTTATGSTTASSAPETMDGSTYVVRLRDLEQRVDELKEQIRRSHTRLSLLSDTILSGGVGGARAEINFRNELSNAFHLTGATFVLDGSVQFNKQDDTGALAEQKQIPIFSGSIPPGDHTLQVVLKLRGHGYGVFSYLRGYKFNVPATHSFTVTEGKAIKLDAIVWEKGDVTTPLEERPAIRWQQTVSSSGEEGHPEATSSAPAKANVSGTISVGAGAK